MKWFLTICICLGLSVASLAQGISITCLNAPLGYKAHKAKLVYVAQRSAPIRATSSLLVTWFNDPNAATWTIKRSLVSGGPYTTMSSGLTQPGCVDNTVAPKTTYYYVVSATNSVGTSSDSTPEAQGTTP